MNRIDAAFERLRAEQRFGLFPYLTAGYPERDATQGLALAAIEAGADGLELGIPFSDPVADGVTMQRAGEIALSQGASLDWALGLAARIRAETQVPIVAMTYYNPIHHMGVDAFVQKAAASGLDGIIVPDLPSIEADPLRAAAVQHDFYVVEMLAPTSTEARIAEVGRLARGFVYCVSLLGTTGVREAVSARLPSFLGRVRRMVATPLLVGFGIARPEHITNLRPHADACVVASAIADLLEATPKSECEAALLSYLSELRAACDSPLPARS